MLKTMSDLHAEVLERIHEILIKPDINSNGANILDNLRKLRDFCAQGTHIQFQIASHECLQQFLQNLLFGEFSDDGAINNDQLQVVGWQLVANMTVYNQESLLLVWKNYGNDILQYLNAKSKLEKKVDVMLMIMYNVVKSECRNFQVDIPLMLRAAVNVWHSILEQQCTENFDFLHFIFEQFLVNNGRISVKCYTQLNTAERLIFLDYLTRYLQQESPNGLVHTFLLQYISKELKIKSDSILCVASSQEVSKVKPDEAYALLRCIACASGSENYSQQYSTDHSLFLNISSLLRCVVAAGKDNRNTIFTPMSKLEEVAPTSTIPIDYQSEISFELKTLLIRCIANLLYNNDKNKQYCLDTELLPALFECTNMDARNPLMKEWSILAIRNACIDCPPVQKVIANLTQKGLVENDILTELNLDMGSLRINPKN